MSSRSLRHLACLGLLLGACSGDTSDPATDTSPVDTIPGDTQAGDTEGDTAVADTTEPVPITDITPWVPTCGDPPALAARSYTATIRWGSYGIPYISGSDLPNAYFAQSWAMAKDHLCTLADQYVAVRSERAMFFGAGAGNANVNSDLGWLAVGLRDRARCQLATMSPESRETLRAVVAGYNQYLEDTSPADYPPACKDAAWVRPVDELDVASFYLSTVVRASSSALAGSIATTEPPTETASVGPMSDIPYALAESDAGPHPSLGSNGWAIGKDRSANGRGLLFSNPHFPWEGALRFYESQITVPGEVDVHGVSLVGIPMVLIGFNKDVAWTHTVSASTRFTIYVLTLDPTDPTVYLYGDERRRMAQRTVSVQVKETDGTMSTVDHTYYYSHYGPIVSLAPLNWSADFALTYRDGNIDNVKIFDQYRGMDSASNFDEFKAAFRDESGIPWINTMYADKDGNAYYIDATPVGKLSADTMQWWRDAVDGKILTLAGRSAQLLWLTAGAFGFDGSTPDQEWVESAGARDPGLTPFAEQPQLTRTDYVVNANDSHWLSNPSAPLEGYSFLYGAERTPRSYRTRMNTYELQETPDSPDGADGKFTMEELATVRTNGRAWLADQHLATVVARCTGVVSVDVNDATVPLEAACATLAAWDGRLTTDSAGGPLWREFVSAFGAIGWTAAFDADSPVMTPGGFPPAPATGVDPVAVALGKAVQRLASAGFDPDVTLGEAQYTMKGTERLPIPGGLGGEGAVNVVGYGRNTTTLLPGLVRPPVINSGSGLTQDGYPVTNGTSFVMSLEFGADGPRAQAVLTYSQSDDPRSEHYADQTRLFSEDGWRQVRFTEAEIAADPNLTTMTVTTE